MTDHPWIEKLISDADADRGLSAGMAKRVLADPELDTFDLLQAAWYFRRKHFGRRVMVQVLNNVQNGMCPEDCRYCAQSSAAGTPVVPYSMKPDEEIFREAEAAWKAGAGRYCMVFAGTGPTDARVDDLVAIVREIKRRHALEVCVSAGQVNEVQARKLKEAGLDRLNHNLNTSERYYPHICSTHTWAQRLETVRAARRAGLEVCSGVIIGMGESRDDVVAMAGALRDAGAASVPVNFFIPVPGAGLTASAGLSPDYCLRVLCLFRLMLPRAEIRMAAGRELHLRSLEPLGLYAANSLFIQGYLTARGSSAQATLTMIRDAGFSVCSELPIDDVLASFPEGVPEISGSPVLKTPAELRPCRDA